MIDSSNHTEFGYNWPRKFCQRMEVDLVYVVTGCLIVVFLLVAHNQEGSNGIVVISSRDNLKNYQPTTEAFLLG